MRFDEIIWQERLFLKTGKGIAGSRFTLENKSISGLSYIKCSPTTNDGNYYYNQNVEKTAAVIHFTEGFIKSDLYYLTHKGHVSVAFYIARGGEILNLHSSRKWAYHLGKGASGGNTTMSKSTIPIELSNIGALTRKGDILVSRYGDEYCHVLDKDQYHQLEEDFRGHTYFATHTDAQYDSLAVLLKYLNKSRGIELNFLPEEKRFIKLPSSEIRDYRGILTHINFRNDLDQAGKYKKVDIGRGFQWDKLENSL